MQPKLIVTLTFADVILMTRCGACWAEPGTECDRSVRARWVLIGRKRFHALRLDRAWRRAGALLEAIRR